MEVLRAVFERLYAAVPWLFPVLRSLFGTFTSSMADLSTLLFHSGASKSQSALNELFVDEQMTAKEKVEHFSKSDIILHRLFVLREMETLAEEVGFAGVKDLIIPMFERLSEDLEPVVRAAAMEKIPALIEILMEPQGPIPYISFPEHRESSEVGCSLLCQAVLPIVGKVLMDKNPQALTNAHEALLQIAEALRPQQLLEQVDPIISKLLVNMDEEDNRVEALMLMTDLAPLYSKHGLIHHIVPRVKDYSADPSFRVRKACVDLAASLCPCLTEQEVTTILLPIYLELCEDKIWGVRKGCGSGLPFFGRKVAPAHREKELLAVFEKLSQDTSKWVKVATLEALGPYIACFDQDEVPSVLIDHFEEMASSDSELVFACAFNFPAVVLTLGPSEWPRLRSLFLRLSGDMQWRVRRTLAYSLHELAKILGRDITEEDLLPVFELYLLDVHDVRLGVMTNFSKFVGGLSPSMREAFLSRLGDYQEPQNSWRFRQILAEQMPELVAQSTQSQQERYLNEQILQFAHDPVSLVREASIPAVCSVLASLDLSGPPAFLERLLLMHKHPTFAIRQFFAAASGDVAGAIRTEDFQQHFLPALERLSEDTVPNVRIAVARSCHRLSKIELLGQDERVIKVLELLRMDEDPDVKEACEG